MRAALDNCAGAQQLIVEINTEGPVLSRQMAGDQLEQDTTASFQILSNSCCIGHPTIRRYGLETD
jgi:hypothetical protein